jgi:transposase
MRLAATHSTWVLGFEDEVWWSRLAQPALSSWTDERDQPLRLVEQAVASTDPDPKALACYGLLVRSTTEAGAAQEQTWLRFIDGRPVSASTTAVLAWWCAKLQAAGKEALLLVWDNAPWHVSRAVRTWIRAHNQRVKWSGRGVRIICCPLPIKSPWLNPIEPKWAHGKRRVVEPARLLSADELIDRVYAAFGSTPAAPLHIHQDAA